MKPFRKYFKRGVEKHFANSSEEIMTQTDRQYQVIYSDVAFAELSINPIDRRLLFTAYFLALIQVLEKRNLDFEQIRNICLEITIDYVQPRNSLQLFFKKLPPKLIGLKIVSPLLSLFAKRIAQKGHVDGFKAEMISDKKETFGLGFGIDIVECGICKLFAKHHAFRYASILCEVDKITSGLAGLELIRNGTIANGAAKCDFRFRKKS